MTIIVIGMQKMNADGRQALGRPTGGVNHRIFRLQICSAVCGLVGRRLLQRVGRMEFALPPTRLQAAWRQCRYSPPLLAFAGPLAGVSENDRSGLDAAATPDGKRIVDAFATTDGRSVRIELPILFGKLALPRPFVESDVDACIFEL